MKSIASFLLIFIIALNPAMREALEQITKMEIVSGAVDLQETQQVIDCIGIQNGKVYQITALWKGGFPAWIKYKWIGVEL